MTTSPFDPSVCVTDAGVFMPRLDDVLTWLKAQYTTIYGSTVDLDPESPDGQVVGIEAEMFADQGQLIQMAFNSLASPLGATGSVLANLCLLNGVTRRPGEYTISPITIEGTAGSSVDANFIIRNTANGKLFSPTATITIANGATTATGYAKCREMGDIEATAGTLTQIITVTTGIVSVTNATSGARGYLKESEGYLRARRYQSVALPSQGMTDGLQAALINMTGVVQAIVWENDEDTAVTLGTGTLAPHSIYVLCDVIAGSDVDPARDITPDAIATVIFNRKSGGCSTQGGYSKTITDAQGKSHVIRYDKPSDVNVYVEVNLVARYGWPTDGATQIAQYIEEWGAGTDTIGTGNRNVTIGGDSNGELSWTDVLASFVGKVGGFNLTSMKLGTTLGGGTVNTNLPIDFDEIARLDASRVTVNVT
jgi:hypothetical protein